MKKLVALALLTSFAAFTFLGCSNNAPAPSPSAAQATVEPTQEPADTASEATTEIPAATSAENAVAPAAATAGGFTGYSVETTISSSKPATADAPGQIQVDSYIVYTTIGADGKIQQTGIDSAQTRIPFDAKGQIPADFDLKQAPQTKVELGANYGLTKASAIGKEWFEQAQAFADYTVGKTPAEVDAIQTKVVDDHHQNVADTPDLTSSVTIDIGAFKRGVAEAANNKLLGDALPEGSKTGMGVVTSVAKSKAATADAAGLAQVDSVIAVVSVGADGKIAQLKFDNAQTKVEFNADGTIKTDLAAPVMSKQQLGDNYGLIKASKIGKEWYQQADAFAQYCIGKTIDEVKGIQTKSVDESHPNVPDVPELTSSVTITVQDYIAALEKAISNAK